MNESTKYAKIVEWSEKDQCYVGSAPGLVFGGCHGDDEQKVFAELCRIVEGSISLYHHDGKPLPPFYLRKEFCQSNARTRITKLWSATR